MSDRIFASIWILLCISGLFIGWGIQSEYSYEPLGPRPFPMAILALMTLCAVLLLLRKPDVIAWPHAKVLHRLLVMVITLVLYAWGFESLGFPLATALLTFSIALLFKAKVWVAALSGVVLGASLFYAFDYLLDVTLPLGVWLN
ncbi:tripartite tricarboxylate transporter TctB family protein [Yersinia intermedia]|jgi:putative tricarboxylic transport membrane protein|uniref:Tripartite tricarboxylate transporter TctB family protein n=1 Tax=Yersinia intermedia TaxID=631 RepID=A0A208ZUM2_YERIN|nr:tripartite tricarboxylate transporter TctB family protein [Yersinia intermedia]MCB5315332.1 tripartite tricarboxylate transporter TctB family protein [Yersinia intermedia]MCB5321731.1 tripartite tricarboxylate transporter TctB family protein [Yersinia intermedia]MCB5329457.1 tripartite tricarboxylate transporter TctB family protein [Yersinia intermedia]OVZ84165.1 tripartite tricarboxylate transporter TctB family protein [Yersinia intermedia]UNK22908.1 tripartite tricarboxylate transporter T